MDIYYFRTKRQLPKDIKQGCETTGYEKRLRELCEEVVDRICKVIIIMI